MKTNGLRSRDRAGHRRSSSRHSQPSASRPRIVPIERREGIGHPGGAGGRCQQTHLAPGRSFQRLRGRPHLDRALLGFGLRAAVAMAGARPIHGTCSARLTASPRLVIPHGSSGLRLGRPRPHRDRHHRNLAPLHLSRLRNRDPPRRRELRELRTELVERLPGSGRADGRRGL